MCKWTMPKFLSELTPSDWSKLAGLAVMGALLYSDVQGSIEKQAEHNARQDAKITSVEKTVAEAIVKQAEVNEKISETLSAMNRSLGAIETSNQQMNSRIERIERKL